MSLKAYRVKLKDVGHYTLEVVAGSERQAEDVAKTEMLNPALPGLPGLTIDTREIEAEAELAESQPKTAYRVTFWHRLKFEMTVPASDRETALRHAEWLVDDTGPLDYDLLEEGIDGFQAQVAS